MSKPSVCRTPTKSTLRCQYINPPEIGGESRWCRRAASPPAGARGTLSGRQVILASLLFLLPPQAAKQATRVNRKALITREKDLPKRKADGTLGSQLT